MREFGKFSYQILKTIAGHSKSQSLPYKYQTNTQK